MMCDVVSPAATGGGDRGSAKGKSGGTKKRKSAVASRDIASRRAFTRLTNAHTPLVDNTYANLAALTELPSC